ncbi:uncharacterized protein LOC112341043 [Selaginella moellendorffii]|uniref:uncharacterized protein LOC112341043 n=1 Tax=Selaginella moellendorffii TaxID=88036 RepID=UPI000D1C9EE6|nr:uncharacterized protein LOC112341043 [Selaginella moellendorffii]|eukprot:XP_024516203.1 uncharacterized protein LOC112341043 [Selaginella moellendorffii]
MPQIGQCRWLFREIFQNRGEFLQEAAQDEAVDASFGVSKEPEKAKEREKEGTADRISMLRSLWKDHKELLDPENSIMGSPGSSGGDGRNGNRGGGGGSGGSNDGSLPWKILSSLGFVVLCCTLFGAALTSKLTPSLASIPITIAWLVDFTASMVLMLSGLLINVWLLRAAALTGLAILKSCWWLFSELRDCVVAQGGWMRENVGGGGAAAVLLLSIPTFFAFLPGNRAFVTGFLVRARAFMLSVWHKLGSFRSSRRSEGMYSRVYGIFSK